VADVRFLLLDHDYIGIPGPPPSTWQRHPGVELRPFLNLHVLFKVEASLDEWWTRTLSRFTPRTKYMWDPLEGEIAPSLKHLYDQELAKARLAEKSVVPGYSICDYACYHNGYYNGRVTEPWDLDTEHSLWINSPQVFLIRKTPN